MPTNKKDFLTNLVVFVAGYGGWDNGKAYIVPKDAQPRAADRARSSCILLTDFRSLIENLHAPHSLVLIDACFGGNFDRKISSTDTVVKDDRVYSEADYLQITNDKAPFISAKYITSGGKEYVADDRPGHHSPFANHIIKELDNCYENAQPLTFKRLVTAVKQINPQPRAGDFGLSQPEGDFILIPTSLSKGKGNKPVYDARKSKTTATDDETDGNKPNALNKEELEPKTAYIKGGNYPMGSVNKEFKDEWPIHTVKLDGFYIGKYEVTQRQWKDIMGYNPSEHAGCDDCPVEMVSWEEVQRFIYKLNKRTKKQYRLPTEAEWEFAARQGNDDMAFDYSGADVIDWVGWYNSNSNRETHIVGQKTPNSLGIYDMTGNVWEWCSDKYGSYSERDLQENPTGPKTDGNYIIRGGSYDQPAIRCRNAYRSDRSPSTKEKSIGFRLVHPE